MKKVLSFRMDEELINRLKELSEVTYIPQVKLIELALEEYLSKKEKEVK